MLPHQVASPTPTNDGEGLIELLRGIAAARRETDADSDEVRCGITLAESEMLDEAAALLERYREALFDIRNSILCPVGPTPSLDEIEQKASAALNQGAGR
jgi:hypothetical protein